MKPFDDLLRMTDAERLAHLREEVERVIARARPGNVLKLRALQARCDDIRSRVKNPYVSAQMIYTEMVDRLNELNEVLK